MAEPSPEARLLRMYIKIDASTKYDLPVHVPTRDQDDGDTIGEREHHYTREKETLLSYYENKNILRERVT